MGFVRGLHQVCAWRCGLSIFTIIAAVPLTLSAENVANFYPADSARTVFAPDVHTTTVPDLNDFGALRFTPKEKSVVKATAAASNAQASKPERPETFQKEVLSHDEILKSFGDPNQELPVLAIDDAPSSFKGMQMALEAGDHALAYSYAKQYVRYLNKVQSRTRNIMSPVDKIQRADEKGKTPAPQQFPQPIDDYAVTPTSAANLSGVR